jgi:putative transposase
VPGPNPQSFDYKKSALLERQHLGGRRDNAGPKPLAPGKRNVAHRRRAPLASRYPVHVTLRLDKSLPQLRTRRRVRTIERAFRQGCDRPGFRLAHYTIQRHHLHLIVEAKSALALSRGMQGLSIRLAKGLNALWGRSGRVFADRYHARILKTPLEVKRALAYVLNNTRRHADQRGRRVPDGYIDEGSSARFLLGFAGRDPPPPPGCNDPVARPGTWLLAVGWWKTHGPIDPNAVPGPLPKLVRRAEAR